MTRYFPLDGNPYNKLYAEIAETIKQYYPIGVTPDDPQYKEHPGTKKIMALMAENLNHNENFNRPWIDFLEKLRNGSKREIHDISLPHDLSFNGELIIELYDDESLQRVKKIVFSVSFITPYFSIYGVDETFIREKNNGLTIYRAINVITESPYKEFETDFNYLQHEIETQFISYKIVPVRTSMLFVEGLHTPQFKPDKDKLHNALFNNQLDFTPFTFFRGDPYYGISISTVTVDLLPPPPIA